MTMWLCVHQPGNQNTIVEADTSADAVRKCDSQFGVTPPDSNVSAVYLLTKVHPDNDKPYATDGMGSWFSVDDLEIVTVPWRVDHSEDVEEALQRERPEPAITARRLSFDEWERRYDPMVNLVTPNSSFEGRMFETHGEDLAYIHRCPETTVWTMVDVDGVHIIVPGLHHVNRVGYFRTRVGYGRTRAPDEIYVNPDPAIEPEAYLRFRGYSPSDSAGTAAGYAKELRAGIHIFVTSSSTDGQPLSAETRARIRVYRAISDKDPFYEIELEDLASLPTALKAAETRALILIEEPLERLSAEYAEWIAEHDLPDMSAEALIHESLTPAQRSYLSGFILRWEAAEAAAELEPTS